MALRRVQDIVLAATALLNRVLRVAVRGINDNTVM
jgi:hypothetical protein